LLLILQNASTKWGNDVEFRIIVGVLM